MSNNVNINSFGNNYGFYQNDSSKAKTEEHEIEKNAPAASKQSQVSANEVLDALSIMGAQTLASVSNTSQVNPANHLSADRIASIEESMALFEKGVEKFAGAIQEEFGDILGEDVKLALAAEAFSRA